MAQATFIGWASVFDINGATRFKIPVYELDAGSPGDTIKGVTFDNFEPISNNIDYYNIEGLIDYLNSIAPSTFNSSKLYNSIFLSKESETTIGFLTPANSLNNVYTIYFNNGSYYDWYGSGSLVGDFLIVKVNNMYGYTTFASYESKISIPSILVSEITLTQSPELDKTVVNFFRSTPPLNEDIVLERGQSIEVGFTIVYEGEEGVPYTGEVIWENSTPDVVRVEGNTITALDDTTGWFGSLTAICGEYPDFSFPVGVTVSNPLGIYDKGGTTGGVNQTGGGGSYGKLPDGSIEQSDPIDIPNGTVASPATATGFFTRYLADTNTISTFGRWLWTTDLGLQVAKAVISLIYGDPAQSVISLMSYPFNISTLPEVLQSTGNIVWGNFNSGISSDILNSQASQIDWGTIQLNEYWGNFLDYSPHTKVSLYLPWGTGFVDLDPGECLPGTLNVKTNIDFSKGSCVHNVFGNGNLIGSFAGQCAQQIPVLSSDFASKVAGLVTAAAAGISASAVGGAGVLAEAAMGFPNATISGGDDKVLASFSDAKRAAGRIATTSLAINRHPVNVTRNGGFTDGSAALGCQYPYVIISRPKQSMPVQYGSHFGYPSNIYRRLGTLTGYTEVGEIHLEGIPATDAELSELDRILKGGVIF